MPPVSIAQLRTALHAEDYKALRALHAQAKDHGIQGCDTEDKFRTVMLALLQAATFKGTSPAHTRTVGVMLDAIERGHHPYDDREAMASMRADAAIAQAQLDAWTRR
jgi:hypothetical protein